MGPDDGYGKGTGNHKVREAEVKIHVPLAATYGIDYSSNKQIEAGYLRFIYIGGEGIIFHHPEEYPPSGQSETDLYTNLFKEFKDDKYVLAGEILILGYDPIKKEFAIKKAIPWLQGDVNRVYAEEFGKQIKDLKTLGVDLFGDISAGQACVIPIIGDIEEDLVEAIYRLNTFKPRGINKGVKKALAKDLEDMLKRLYKNWGVTYDMVSHPENYTYIEVPEASEIKAGLERAKESDEGGYLILDEEKVEGDLEEVYKKFAEEKNLRGVY